MNCSDTKVSKTGRGIKENGETEANAPNKESKVKLLALNGKEISD